MGMYTEIYVNVDFKEGTPQHVIDIIRCVTGDIEEGSDRYNELAIKFPRRFLLLFHNMSYYTPYTCCSKLTYDEYIKTYSLIGKGDIKNYNGEIELFFDFIKPYVEDRFMGYSRYEECEEPTLVYAW